MLLYQATVRNVSRAFREIKAFEWEGDYRPMARQALKEILEKRLEEEMSEFLRLYPYEHACARTDYRNGHYIRHLLTELGVFTNTQSLQKIVFAVFYHLNHNWSQCPLKQFTHNS